MLKENKDLSHLMGYAPWEQASALRGKLDEIEPVASCTPQDFALTEAEMSAYDTRRQSRCQRIDLDVLAPLDVALKQRLRQWQQVQPQPGAALC